MKTTIKIPVLVREDGAFFVWEMDTSSDLKHPGHGDPSAVATRAAVMLTSREPPFYRDIHGKSPDRARVLHRQAHGALRLVYLEVEVDAPAPLIEAAETVAPEVSE